MAAKRAPSSRPQPKKVLPAAEVTTGPEPSVRALAPSESTPAQPAQPAVAMFEQAMRAMQQHDYRTSASVFRQLVSEFPGERALLDRARVYLGLCERELRQRSTAPESLEEQLTAATAALNIGNDREAERLIVAVLGQVPHHDLALYLMAVLECRRGQTDRALSRLAEAIAVSPDVRAQARHDDDFAVLRGLTEFQRLTALTDEPGPRSSRR